MDSPAAQLGAFDAHWPAMRTAAETGGAPAVIAYIRGQEDGLLQRILWSFARKGLVMSPWEGKDVGTPLAVALAGIDVLLAQSQTATDPDVARKRLDAANIVAWNAAADVADCWPDDELPRTPEQLATALELAERCVHWRDQLGKGPHAKGMGHWLHGYLLLRAGRADAAVTAFEASLAAYREAAGEVDTPVGEASFSVVLLHGYLGLARAAAGQDGTAFDEAVGIFAAQEVEGGENASFGRGQLLVAQARVGLGPGDDEVGPNAVRPRR